MNAKQGLCPYYCVDLFSRTTWLKETVKIAKCYLNVDVALQPRWINLIKLRLALVLKIVPEIYPVVFSKVHVVLIEIGLV